ncbi:hypothetical protein [Labedella endophytica]|uniref:Uncharacterized protein n=1 Tax=Labedella endophytica TaxID=1523160 RepID=A0A433JR41_9MICO|nr:hypothetical protein [Labedella endophytica]RUR00782.1 hypothetical protein ELQ94_04270 [Labedella endophytica]
MRAITYAGETVTTTDRIAEVLVDLTAALAKRAQAEAVRIPIALDGTSEKAFADLVVGVGNDVLSVPQSWHEPDPEWSEEFDALDTYLRTLTRADLRPAPKTGRRSDSDLFDLDI